MSPRSLVAALVSLALIGSLPHGDTAAAGAEEAGARPAELATMLRFLGQAAERGGIYSQVCLGDLYRTGAGVPQDYAEAAKWYRMAALAGNARAQAALGDLYREGLGVARDPAEAAKWYQMAAEQGHPSAQSKLATMCATGEGVPVDFSRAVRLHRDAAWAGDAVAQYELGRYYAEGRIVERDAVAAYVWLWLAVHELDPERRSGALEELYELERTMTAQEVREAQSKLRSWQRHR